jgi:hypothetical protein
MSWVRERYSNTNQMTRMNENSDVEVRFNRKIYER